MQPSTYFQTILLVDKFFDIPRLVDIDAFINGYKISQQLQRHDG